MPHFLVLVSLLFFMCQAREIELKGPLLTVGIVPSVEGIALTTYDLNSKNPLVGVVDIPNDPGSVFIPPSEGNGVLLALDRNRGVAVFHVLSRLADNPNSFHYNISLLQYRYLDQGQLMPVPEEISRCKLGGNLTLSQLFVSSAGDIFGVQRTRFLVDPFLKISSDCSIKNLGSIPSTYFSARMTWFLRNDKLYYPSTDSSVVELNTKTLEVKEFNFPLPDRRFGIVSYFTLDQYNGIIRTANVKGRGDDWRSWRFSTTGQQIIQTTFFNIRIGLGEGLTRGLSVNGTSVLMSNWGTKFFISDPVTLTRFAWTSPTKFTTPREWELHTLDVN